MDLNLNGARSDRKGPKTEKVKVGLISCMVRRWKDRRKGRCPRCLASGDQLTWLTVG